MDLTLLNLLAFASFLLMVGYLLPFTERRLARAISWGLAMITVLYSDSVTAGESSLYRMIAIVSLQLLSMKVIVMVETYSGKPKLNVIQWCAFSIGWFGMRPVLFELLPAKSLPGGGLMIKGAMRIIFGFGLVYLSSLVEQWLPDVYFLSELLLLVGLSLILHFGLLNLSTAGWRAFGVDVRELFRSPYKAKSLKEFWGKRWNVAFSEMTALIVYRPLKTSIRPNSAMVVSFLFSGLLHEIAISLPVKSGFGLPLLYFAIHAVLMQLEDKSIVVKRVITHPVASHVWVLGWLVVPMPLLFHANFIQYVLIPLRNQILSVF